MPGSGGFTDASGLFAVCGHRDAARLTAIGLHALQHRGSVGAAVAVSDGHLVRRTMGRGRVASALDATEMGLLTGTMATGMVWGRAWGGDPLDGTAAEAGRMVFGRNRAGQVVASVSGRFTNGSRLRRELKGAGALFHTPSDAELLLHLMAHSGQRTFVNRLVDALWKVKGAYAVIVMAEDRLVAVRDPSGFRPLALGRVEEAMVVSTEDAAIRFAGGALFREVLPGEMVVVDGRKEQALRPFPEAPVRACSHELVSLARADASTFGCPVYAARRTLGERLAREQPCKEASVVVAMPGSEAHAEGFAVRAKGQLAPGLLPEPVEVNHLALPSSGVGTTMVRSGWRPVSAAVVGQSVCLVAASVVRGDAARKAVAALMGAGAEHVHLRVASPWVRAGCPYGVSSPTTDELLHSRLDADPQTLLGASSVGFLSQETFRQVLAGMPGAPRGFCDGCFSGELPIPPEEPDDQLPLFDEGSEQT